MKNEKKWKVKTIKKEKRENQKGKLLYLQFNLYATQPGDPNKIPM
jgi:hypothetical protein